MMAAFFKKIYSRKVVTFFLVHFTILGMYIFGEPSTTLVWAMMVNALGFISLNSLDKAFVRWIEYVKATKE